MDKDKFCFDIEIMMLDDLTFIQTVEYYLAKNKIMNKPLSNKSCRDINRAWDYMMEIVSNVVYKDIIEKEGDNA